MNEKRPYKASWSGILTLIGAIVFSCLLYQADVRNVPIISPWLDFFGAWTYRFLPLLKRLPRPAFMMISSGEVGLVALIIATVIVALLLPSSKVGRMEGQMRDMQNDRRPPSAKIK